MIIYIEDRVKALQEKIVRAQTHKNGFKSPLTESKVTILTQSFVTVFRRLQSMQQGVWPILKHALLAT